MGGFDDDANMDDGKRAERKYKKHMVEKRRRNRINYALDQLKMMVLEGLDKDPTKYDKMEKADILDLTVKYLHRILKENIHFGPEMMQALPPMFGEHFAGSFLQAHLHPQGMLPEPCPSSSYMDEPLDLHRKGTGMTTQSEVSSLLYGSVTDMTASQSAETTSQSMRSSESQSRSESPCIDIDSDSDYSDNETEDIDIMKDSMRDSVKGFKPVKKHHSSHPTNNFVKRPFGVHEDEIPSKRLRPEHDRESSQISHTRSAVSTNLNPAFSSIKLNITGHPMPHHLKPGPSSTIIRPVATVPRLSLRNTNVKSYPVLPYPSHPFPTIGAPLIPLPMMHSDPSWRPW